MVEAEKLSEYALAAGLFQDSQLIEEYGDRLTTEHFADSMCAMLWDIAKAYITNGTPFELATIWPAYGAQLEDAGGIDKALLLMQSYYSHSSAPLYVEQLEERLAKKKLVALNLRVNALLSDPSLRHEEIYQMIESGLSDSQIRPKIDYRSVRRDRVVDWMGSIEELSRHPNELSGISTGLVDLDRMTQGLQRQDLIVIAARTSMGKSAFTLQIAVNANRLGYKVSIFSLEMSYQQVLNRMFATTARVDFSKFRTGAFDDRDWSKISMCLDELSTITIVDERGISTPSILSQARKIKRSEGLDLVIVDYVQLVNEPAQEGDNQGTPLKRVTQALRQMAKECNCAVIAISQVSRAVEQRQNKRPNNSDLSESKALEEGADVIGFLYREDYYDQECQKKNIMECIVTKQRNGPTGTIELVYLKNYQAILSLNAKGD